jgi:hypothetical protein
MNVQPVPGFWYRDVDADETFTVLHFDEENGLIEVQYGGGDITQIAIEVWDELDLELAERP